MSTILSINLRQIKIIAIIFIQFKMHSLITIGVNVIFIIDIIARAYSIEMRRCMFRDAIIVVNTLRVNGLIVLHTNLATFTPARYRCLYMLKYATCVFASRHIGIATLEDTNRSIFGCANLPPGIGLIAAHFSTKFRTCLQAYIYEIIFEIGIGFHQFSVWVNFYKYMAKQVRIFAQIPIKHFQFIALMMMRQCIVVIV
uniref:Uncharacterized protein n=1 Tax=Drosophila-associated filamentous virus TaxID=2743186 RepID=A0A6M9TZZ6_9VIRU|nr:putative protein 10 [Drosophila-associated filamentous virus]